MKFSSTNILALFSFAVLASANVLKRESASVQARHEGEDHLDETPGSGGDYVVLVEDEDPRTIPQLVEELGANMSDVRYVYDNPHFKGFAASMSKHCASRLATFQGIAEYDQRVMFHADAIQSSLDVPWGLQRISQRGPVGNGSSNPRSLIFNYTFEDTAGQGVDIYIVDTGINTKHIDFEGRARVGFAFDNDGVDRNGHGTHCAGTAGSSTFGVARKANLIAVKVLGADGSGGNDDIIAGLNFVAQEHERRKNEADFRGSIVSMSLGAETRSLPLERALNATIRAGVHVSVASGNAAKDACLSSPGAGSQNSAIVSVGAIDINDRRASFSNFGRCVTTYAPGVTIFSTFIDPEDPENGRQFIIHTLSGTSMACPHVTGLMATYLALNSDLATDPAALKRVIVENSVPVDLQDLPVAGDPEIVATNLGTLGGVARSRDLAKRPVLISRGRRNLRQL